MMHLLAGSDDFYPTVVGMHFADPAHAELGRLRVAFYADDGYTATVPEVNSVLRSAAQALAGLVQTVREDRPNVLACAYDFETKLLGADGGDSQRRYLEHSGSTELHPLLTGWLDKLELYRTELAGFQGYWAELARYEVEMFAFLLNYDPMPGLHPTLPHGASIIDHNFRGFSHTMADNLTGSPAAVVHCGHGPFDRGANCSEALAGGLSFGSGRLPGQSFRRVEAAEHILLNTLMFTAFF
jgi:amidase